MNERIISVRGNGKLEISPNLTVVDFDIEVEDEDYDEAYENYKYALEILTEIIISLGFEKSDLKTKRWDASPVNVYEEIFDNETGKYRGIKISKYRISHSLKIEFSLNSEKLSNLLSKISKYELPLEMIINHDIKEKETVKNELLEKAVIDERNKAKVMVAALGEELGELKKINYNVSDYSPDYADDFVESKFCESPSLGSIFSDFEPENLKFNDAVELIWGIK